MRIGNLNDLEVGTETAFEEFIDGQVRSFVGLKEFIKTELDGADIFIFDNHNHAFYFWHEAFFSCKIGKENLLVHIDEHTDMKEPRESFLPKFPTDSAGAEPFLDDIFRYTNEVLQVGDFIRPSLSTGIIGEVANITGESSLEAIPDILNQAGNRNIVLDLDMDFFSPGMSYIQTKKKIDVIRQVALRSSLITIATSPYFMDQEEAISLIKEIFGLMLSESKGG